MWLSSEENDVGEMLRDARGLGEVAADEHTPAASLPSTKEMTQEIKRAVHIYTQKLT